MMTVAFSKENRKLSQDLQGMTGENVMLCYQCKKCTLGCPSAYAMRRTPMNSMRGHP
jgi:heterodisulfide reductase subunit C